MAFFDTHAHLDQAEFDADRDAVIERARAVGVETILCVGVSADTSQAAVQLAERYSECYAAVGIQPNSAAEAKPGDWERIVSLARHPRVVALGETGLDRYWDTTPFDLQREYFLRHIELSRQSGLPLVIHCRDAFADLLPILREAILPSRPGRGAGGEGSANVQSPTRNIEYPSDAIVSASPEPRVPSPESRAPRPPPLVPSPSLLAGILHSFSGDVAMAAACVELGFHISFAGQVSYTNRKFAPLREAAAAVPADRLLIETDSPYLVPHPLRGRQQRNEPALIVHTAHALAQLRGVSLVEFAAQTTANARRLLGI